MTAEACGGATSRLTDPIDHFALGMISYLDGVAASHRPPVEAFAFGPLAVELSVVGDTFRRRLTTAIEFARVPKAKELPGLWRIVAIDGIEGGIGEPPAWNFPVFNQRNLECLHQDADSQLSLRFDPYTKTWRVLSLSRRVAVVWTADASKLPDWSNCIPCRELFHWMTVPTGCFLAHAATIGIDGRGVS